ncbi:MAG: menaquinone biosynthesis protein [Tumebacillaceae bacterium]
MHRSGLQTLEHARKIRIGQIKFTNALPLCHFIDNANPLIEKVPGAQNELNAWLAEGSVDMGLVSAFAYAQIADDYALLRGLSISSRGPVGSILFFSKRPLAELDGCVVALPTTSASAANLTKILLAEMGVKPTYITREPDLPRMMEEADAALLIADFALYWGRQEHPYLMFDLGEEWHNRTGHSMTFGVCAVPKRLIESDPDTVREIHRLFLESKRKSLANMEAIYAEAQAMLGQNAEYWKQYFSKLIYEFDENMAMGANAYFDAAYRHGLLPKPVKVELWGDEK